MPPVDAPISAIVWTRRDLKKIGMAPLIANMSISRNCFVTSGDGGTILGIEWGSQLSRFFRCNGQSVPISAWRKEIDYRCSYASEHGIVADRTICSVSISSERTSREISTMRLVSSRAFSMH